MQHCAQYWKLKISLLSRQVGEKQFKERKESKQKQMQLRTQGV